ncbi:hypothetical protein SAMN05443668_108233 [Cryptosporangium aurantiacum]|uniref:Uncharacterized protein n=1 Tax=Cryptosporangium aurantiacum TaxID=134849 RepID=A0A1M7R8F4_9ACTN|nr:hypothetical protein SAMN05443668_108233 [Cryptosporangium aurantiacum]
MPLTHAELCDWAMDMAALFGGNPDPVQWERFAGEARKAADQELALIGDNMATAIRGADYARATNILERDLPAECPPQ